MDDNKVDIISTSVEASTNNFKIKKGDRLILRGLKFHGYHGVHLSEKETGQMFLVDVDAWLDLRAAGKSDDLNDSVSYTAIYRIAKEIMTGPSHDLLESVAEEISSKIMIEYDRITAVRVKVAKPDVVVGGPIDYLGVEIFRSRDRDMAM
ncbi:dihydroneopterin aldolase 2-like [Benincasa hispida]|uniref:dihydroneopterin aldolase 2-like n=1 Tax=Benincasa hispida TaxID=102211 RepID=UPI001900752D|nr:dihydroneopterin aldolase 2-like [Benincasa hispida]XP_038882970.1 dihydroneopterin aldolase 2-like [Benincasa hispida]